MGGGKGVTELVAQRDAQKKGRTSADAGEGESKGKRVVEMTGQGGTKKTSLADCAQSYDRHKMFKIGKKGTRRTGGRGGGLTRNRWEKSSGGPFLKKQ